MARLGTSLPLVTGRDLHLPADLRRGARRGPAREQTLMRAREQLLTVESTVVPSPSARRRRAQARRSAEDVATALRTRGHRRVTRACRSSQLTEAILGRSRGGQEHENPRRPTAEPARVAVILTAGQAGDNPQLEPLLDLHRQQSPAEHRGSGCWPTGRIRIRRPDSSCGAGGSPAPSRIDRTSRTAARPRAAKGGRPPAFDQQTYAKRNTVERGYLRLQREPADGSGINRKPVLPVIDVGSRGSRSVGAAWAVPCG